MSLFLKLFKTTSAYTAAKDSLILPNVSYITEGNDVEYNPYVPPKNIVTYEAPSKLAETTDTYSNGLHTNAFSGTNGTLTMVSHTFDNSVGIIEFNGDITSVGDNAFYSATTMTDVSLPDSVTSIGENAFQDCSSLTSIVIPNSVTSIGDDAFWGCSGLTSVTIPNSVTTIGGRTFMDCKSLTSIDIPDSVTNIGQSAFNGCKSLTSINIPDSVTSIGGSAFAYCNGLTSITSLATTAPTISSYTFQGVKTGGTLYVPIGSSGYDVWMSTGNYYLGKYNWTKVEQ